MRAGRANHVVQAVRSWPNAASWLRAAREWLWLVPLLLLFAWAGGLIATVPLPEPAALALLAATIFLMPALGEELLFRAALIPRNNPSARWQALSVALFVAWHPLQAVTFGPPWAGTFLDPWFLTCVALLGVGLARIYAATRSVWPCVLTHWAVVLVWKAALGGPF